jgi:DNA-binding SARP family transcriptional activator/tetratricopeptide (TPR) repeat protein
MKVVREPSLHLFGYPEVAAPALASTFPLRGFVLFALLAINPGRAMSRSEAAALLWESNDSQASFGNLRQLILRMARAMPSLPSILSVDEKKLRIVDPLDIDVCRFLDLEDMSSVETARHLLSLYRGDLLQGIDLSALPGDDPLSVARTYLRERYFGFVPLVVNGLTRFGHTDPNLLRSIERHALSFDSSREETYRALIAGYGAIGCNEDSRRIFGLLSDTLRRDGLPAPSIETRASLTRATARVVDIRATPATTGAVDAPIGSPRICLLAPNWLVPCSSHNFVRAFVEDVANELARHRNLVTLAAHSSFQASNDGGALHDNSALRADYTVSSFLQPGKGLGILVVRLVNSRSQTIIWASEYPLDNDCLVRSSRILVARIASRLATAVQQDSFGALARTGDNSAYLMFLQGQNSLKVTDLRHVRRARKSFHEAVLRDNRFADAYSGISYSLHVEWLLLGGNDPKLLAEAAELAEAAISLDPNNSTGHWRKAVASLYQHRFDESEECFCRAQELHPNSADILLDYSDALGHVGDADLAWSKFERAIDLNPTPPDHYWWTGASVAFSQADYEKVISLCGRLASDESVLRLLAASHGQLGNKADARHYGQRLTETYPGETAESMARLQPHRSMADLQPFIDGLRVAGVS